MFPLRFEVSDNFVPLGRAGTWAAGGSDYSQSWGIYRPVCQPAAFAAGHAGREPGSPGRMRPEAGFRLGALLSILLQVGKHQGGQGILTLGTRGHE